MPGPVIPCACGSTYQPGAVLRGIQRQWQCVCGRQGWREDREGAPLYGVGDAERVLPVIVAEAQRGQMDLFGGKA